MGDFRPGNKIIYEGRLQGLAVFYLFFGRFPDETLLKLPPLCLQLNQKQDYKKALLSSKHHHQNMENILSGPMVFELQP